MSLITIEQLLESVDLDFEPRWVTKEENGNVWLWDKRPIPLEKWWDYISAQRHTVGRLELAEFENKPWTECIYEVPLKEEPKDKIKIGTLYIDKSVTFGDGDDDDVGFALEDHEVPRKEYKYKILTQREYDEMPCKNEETIYIVFETEEKIREEFLKVLLEKDAVNELKEEK